MVRSRVYTAIRQAGGPRRFMQRTASRETRTATGASLASDSVFMRACRREAVPFTPVWLMRQAGRFMPEYRQIRSRVGFLELCKNSQLAAEVTVMAVEQLAVDAAIIFADILLPLELLGVGLEYAKGDGPVIHRPVRTPADVQKLPKVDVAGGLDYVMQAVSIARKELRPEIPLIGFAGAPFTLASYLIEGGSSRHYEHTKMLMHSDPSAWDVLMQLLSAITAEYLNAQIDAGAQAVQLFDSWVGCLSKRDYQQFIQPHMHGLISRIRQGTPVIHFGTGTSHLLTSMKTAGGDVIGLDWRVNLDEAWESLGYDVAVQGNLDPVVLLSDSKEICTEAGKILKQAAGRPGHIFNLGHGILPQTPVENVKALVQFVHESTGRGDG